MKALVFDARINSLYSITLPFTWQSSLTYPLLPPSAVIGMLANALQRYKNNRYPLEYLNEIENRVVWAGSRLLTPCLIKSYVTSAIVKWEDTPGEKFTNALGREYAYSRKIQVAAIFKDGNLIDDVREAVKTTPLTCGDSESPISIEGEISQKSVTEQSERIVETEYPIPFTKDTRLVDGNGKVFLMHERCRRAGKDFPLLSYMVPVREEERILKPSSLRLEIAREKVLKIEDVANVILRE